MANILPQLEQKEILKLYQKRFLSVVFVFVSLVSIVGIILILPSYFFARNAETDFFGKVSVLEHRTLGDSKQSLSSLIEEINTKLNVFQEKQPTSPLLAGFIDKILAAQIDKIHLSGFTYTPAVDNAFQSNINITGVSDDRESLLAFASKLRSVAGVVSVDVPVASFIKKTNVPFSLSAVFVNK